MGCNARPKENFWNPVPVALVFRNVQAAAKAASDDAEEDDGDDIVSSKPTLRSRSDVKGDLLNSI